MQIWENYNRFGAHRGELVAEILSQFTDLTGKYVLDLGCGNGATSAVLHRYDARVVALDPQAEVTTESEIQFIKEHFEHYDFKNKKFDIIVMQDVLEHLPDSDAALKKCSQLLKRNGLLYIATPNRFSIINFFSDPHWRLPLVSILPRSCVKFFVRTIFRKDRRQREDWAALLSLGRLIRLLKENNFQIKFVNHFVAIQLFENPESVVCDPLHLKIVEFLKKKNWNDKFASIVTDSPGIFNYLINPTWYLIGIRR